MPEVIINGPEGRLECRYMPSETPDAPTALILHPEPDKGGSMNNRVAYALYKHFQTLTKVFQVMRSEDSNFALMKLPAQSSPLYESHLLPSAPIREVGSWSSHRLLQD